MTPNRKNLANGILALGVDSDDTTWVLESGYGSAMPDVPFYLTVTPFGQLSTMGNSEIVNVTAVSTDTLTVERAAKGTTARAFDAGAVVSNGVYVEDKYGSDNIDWATLPNGSKVTIKTKSVYWSGSLTKWGALYYVDVDMGNWPDGGFSSLLWSGISLNNRQYMLGGVDSTTTTAAGLSRLYRDSSNSTGVTLTMIGIGIV